MAMVATMAMVLATLAFTMARGMPMLKPSPTTMVPMVLDMVDSMDTVSAMDMATWATTARERLRLMLSPRLRLIPTTMVPTVLDMVDSMDMVSAMDMATVSTTARGRPRRGQALLLWRIWRVRICPPLRRILRQRILLGISLRALPYHD